jgi:hypothetical protein
LRVKSSVVSIGLNRNLSPRCFADTARVAPLFSTLFLMS